MSTMQQTEESFLNYNRIVVKLLQKKSFGILKKRFKICLPENLGQFRFYPRSNQTLENAIQREKLLAFEDDVLFITNNISHSKQVINAIEGLKFEFNPIINKEKLAFHFDHRVQKKYLRQKIAGQMNEISITRYEAILMKKIYRIPMNTKSSAINVASNWYEILKKLVIHQSNQHKVIVIKNYLDNCSSLSGIGENHYIQQHLQQRLKYPFRLIQYIKIQNMTFYHWLTIRKQKIEQQRLFQRQLLAFRIKKSEKEWQIQRYQTITKIKSLKSDMHPEISKQKDFLINKTKFGYWKNGSWIFLKKLFGCLN
ncbi:UNKNOWN [Stylonychia lemnae]|uniref:Uncharacterized protein n=1 Tax=Stylonychia lemnae TaxID=5949 RepID=A0A078AMX2_STYLE|nr:UNKNOWN [Stylonychia lemnae]|eukprot:CDW83276.1 UNKNOWN [Stylonychia lemnae]